MGRSRSKKAEPFQDWIAEEVIPSIRRTGRYDGAGRKSPITRTQSRLKCDVGTAKARVTSIGINKGTHARMAIEGRVPCEFQEWHNAGYEEMFFANAKQIRKALGQKPRQTPLDRMSQHVLIDLNHAKSLAEKKIADLKANGVDLSFEDQVKLFRSIARKIAESDLAELGSDFAFGVIEDNARGPIVDVVRRQLAKA
jgi:hypothetical protein